MRLHRRFILLCRLRVGQLLCQCGFLRRQIYQLGSGDRFLSEQCNDLVIGRHQPLGRGDLSIDILCARRAILHVQPLRLQGINLAQGVQLLAIQFVGVFYILGQCAVRRHAAIQQLTGTVYLGDGLAQLVIALAGFSNGTIAVQLLRGVKQRLNLRIHIAKPFRSLRTKLRRLRSGLLNLIFEAGQHVSNLLLHHIGHVQIDARADGLQQLVGFRHVASQPRKIQILSTDQLVLALCHAFITS